MIKITTLILLLAGFGTAFGQSRRPRLEWTRTLDDQGKISLASWSPTGSCLAVATDTTVHVIDASGQPLWTWNFRETNRLIRAPRFARSRLAVAPTCDDVVLGGDPGYWYVWVASRGGEHSFFATNGTPLAVKFSLHGDSIAVVTGAPVGYLLSPRLKVLWSGNLAELPVRWASQVVNNASNPQPPEFTREDVDDLFGALLWGRGISDSVSDDGEWRVVTAVDGGSTIELQGPGVSGFRARQSKDGGRKSSRWIKQMGCPDVGELTRDGAFVIATGDPAHPDARKLGVSPACDSGQLSSYVFDRDGNLVMTWPPEADKLEMPAAFRARTGVPLLLQNGSEWGDRWMSRIPTVSADLMTPETRLTFTRSPGDIRVLVTVDREMRVYRRPDSATVQ